MKGYYHFRDIRSLSLGQSLDGEHKPMFNVELEPNAQPKASVAMNEFGRPENTLYVFGEKKLYAYLHDDNDAEDKDVYKSWIADFHKFKETQCEQS